MNILLINPPWEIHRQHNIWRNVASTMPPLGIAWLAAVLEQEKHNVKILDAHAEQMSIGQITRWMHQAEPFHIVGITATTPLINNALIIARMIKKEFELSLVVLGGVHPTVLPEEVLRERAVDIVVRGEGEDTICMIADNKPLENIDGISYRKQDKVEHNPDRKLITDLDSLPFPAYHLLPMHRYHPAVGAAKRFPASSVLATRGCPGRCTFCYRIFGSRLRVRTGRHIANEIKYLYDNYGIREIGFYDDTFTAVKHVVKDFCFAIKEMKLDLSWSCFSRLDTFDENIFRIMKESGCHQVMFGVETSDPMILKNINKKINPNIIRDVIEATKKIGLDVRAAFMLGNPGETEQSLKDNIDFAISLDPDLAIFNITTPFPGTEMFKWADKNGFLRSKNWKDYDLSIPILELPTVSSNKVMEYYKLAHRRFYLRSAYILKRLKRLTNIKEIKALFRSIFIIVKNFNR